MRRSVLHALICGGLASCGGDGPPLAPLEPFLLTVSAEVTRAGFDSTTIRFECDYSLTVVASGGELGMPGRWAPSTWELAFPDGSRTTTSPLTTAVMTQLFGIGEISTGSRHSAAASNWAHLPFVVDYELAYTIDGVSVELAPVTVGCF